MKKKKLKNTIVVMEPSAKFLANLFTGGLFGVAVDTFKAPYEEIRKNNVELFIKETVNKIKDIESKIDPGTIIKRAKSPEFLQLFMKIYPRIQIEKRKKIRRAYSNLFIRLLKEDPKINFNQKSFYLEVLETLNEDHINILSIFYKDGEVKNRFSLYKLYPKVGCYEKRKPHPGEPKPVSSYLGGEEKGEYLNILKSSYVDGLVSDLASKQLIRLSQEVKANPQYKEDVKKGKKVESIKTEIHEEYVGTELGKNFHDSVMNYK